MTDPETLTPREAWQRYLNGRRTEITEESASSYHYRLKLFVEWYEANGVDAVSELDGWTLDRYESHRAGEGIAPSTLHNEMETLKTFVEHLERIEVVDDDHGESSERVPRRDRGVLRQSDQARADGSAATSACRETRDRLDT